METLQALPVTPRARISHLRHHSPPQSPVSNSPSTRFHDGHGSVVQKQQQYNRRRRESEGQKTLDRPTTPTLHVKADDTEEEPGSPAALNVAGDKYSLARPVTPDSTKDSNAQNGVKRTAGGTYKINASIPSTPTANQFRKTHRARAESLASNGSRVGQLAANLKTRLGYAMAKVQNGWEHRNIAEVEQLAAHKYRPSRYSMSHVDSRPRPTSSGLVQGTEKLSFHEAPADDVHDDDRESTPEFTPRAAKRRSENFHTHLRTDRPGHFEIDSRQLRSPVELYSDLRRRQKPSDFSPSRMSSRESSGLIASQSSQDGRTVAVGTAISPPRTPLPRTPRRPQNLRTETQTAEAERDALQALFQLGSPHTSQPSHHSP